MRCQTLPEKPQKNRSRATMKGAATALPGPAGGEIDLILERGKLVVFVEVKKSRDFSHAALRISAAQQQRIFGAAEEYLASCPNGTMTDCRVDVALVDAAGRIKVIENAFAA